jgi:tRNA uridine 5-carboxymethylaminomethyl modification enzyme
MINLLENQKNLTLIIDEVAELMVSNNTINGVKLTNHGTLSCKKAIITAGVYMKSITHIGLNHKDEGPMGLSNSRTLSDSLKELGFKLIRLKTGTPPRVLKSSVDFSKMQVEPGTDKKLSFEHFNPTFKAFENQYPCYLTYTNKDTHAIILENINKSAMYSGNIKGVGPRYCPSIEDKCVRFSDKERHQTFMEPESASLDTIYLQGLSTSLPEDVQDKFLHTIVGLENCKVVKYAYAIEYDAIDPTQLYPTLESKAIQGLYFAGQVNGTSGYEEAAGQGIIAGINATLACQNKKQIILRRDESYIGVMIDDIVTKGVTDPYRLLTSRAEYRLNLRNDNADERLCKIGFDAGLLKKEYYDIFCSKMKKTEEIIEYLKSHSISQIKNKNITSKTHNLYDCLKQTGISLADVIDEQEYILLSQDVIDKVEIRVKFDGYIKNQEKYINK